MVGVTRGRGWGLRGDSLELFPRGTVERGPLEELPESLRGGRDDGAESEGGFEGEAAAAAGAELGAGVAVEGEGEGEEGVVEGVEVEVEVEGVETDEDVEAEVEIVARGDKRDVEVRATLGLWACLCRSPEEVSLRGAGDLLESLEGALCAGFELGELVAAGPEGEVEAAGLGSGGPGVARSLEGLVAPLRSFES